MLRKGMPLYLREWRQAARLTLVQVADRIGQHFTAVQKWEVGVNAVDMRDLERLAAIYGIPPVAFFYHPEDREQAERLARAHKVLANVPADKAEKWLVTGEAFLPPE